MKWGLPFPTWKSFSSRLENWALSNKRSVTDYTSMCIGWDAHYQRTTTFSLRFCNMTGHRRFGDVVALAGKLDTNRESYQLGGRHINSCYLLFNLMQKTIGNFQINIFNVDSLLLITWLGAYLFINNTIKPIIFIDWIFSSFLNVNLITTHSPSSMIIFQKWMKFLLR